MSTFASILIFAGVLIAVVGTFAGVWRESLATALDFWVGAGVLRLAETSDWLAVSTAAAMIAVRHVAGYGLRAARP